jgi:hypothetical protein
MDVIRIRSKTDETGTLHLATGRPNIDVDVIVTTSAIATDDARRENWETFVRETAGSIPNATFQRPPQAPFPIRGTLE